MTQWGGVGEEEWVGVGKVGVMVRVCVAYLLGWAGVWSLPLLYARSPNFFKVTLAYDLASLEVS